MAAYIYGVIDSNDRLDAAMTGLKGTLLRNLPYRDMGVILSDFDKRIAPITKDHAFEHEKVVERLMEHFTVLPFRFPTVFDNEEGVLSMMSARYDNFTDNLRRLRGKMEFGIKVIWPGDKMRMRLTPDQNSSPLLASDTPVKNFLKKKFQEYQKEKKIENEAEARIALVDGFFDGLAAEKKLEKLKTENLLLCAFYLVEKGKQEDFRQAFERLRSSSGEFKYLFSGPWPPYNFIKTANS